ncbi:MAG TPA: LytTR family DNA-binding domain-containing protein [Chryseosolibacter sp.]|nr:LytTR family DNA-binding domain-containing protein [Chryseosolibacter sp.]
MKVIIIEDEIEAAEKLVVLLKRFDPSIEILKRIQSVEDAVSYFSSSSRRPDLMFMDIHLGDGNSFEIFELVNIDAPVIFTTAYDDYALKAFKTNSVDYLLKPIDYQELAYAIDKYRTTFGKTGVNTNDLMMGLSRSLISANKTRFLVKSGGKMKYVNIENVAYFEAQNKYVFLITKSGDRFLVNDKLEALDTQLDERQFFRISRSHIININAIVEFQPYFNSRLVLTLHPPSKEAITVSRHRALDFKKWIDQ